MGIKQMAKENSLLLAIIFAILGIIASSISISAIWGAPGQSFTLFEFLGPLPMAFLGGTLGATVLLIAKFASILALGTPLDLVTIVRLVPVFLGAWFFSSYKANSLSSKAAQIFIPLACMALFMLNPVGAQAWYYSLYWLIPPIAVLLLPTNLFFRSLGATFAQHSLGSVIFLYFVNSLTPAVWIALIPVVAVERLVFAGGISLSYICVNFALQKANDVLVRLNLKPLPLPQKV